MEEKEIENDHGESSNLYPTLTHLQDTQRQQPTAPPMYPVINGKVYTDPKGFRLTEISRIRHELNLS